MSMPQGGESGQQWEGGQQQGPPGGPWQAGQPGQPGAPGQPGPGQQGQGQYYGSPPPQGGGMSGQQYPGSMQGLPASPVNEIETRVSGRRIVQFIVDWILWGIVAGLISWALNRGTGGVAVILTLILIVVDIAWYFLYWAYWPYTHRGQTIGMQLMGVRIISADGGPASLMQLFIRSILLVLFSWVAAIVGFITMMCSRYRQRVGDHMAKTMVVRESVEPIPAQREFAGAGQAGNR
jgi:uncharacterized RDD family membrane protein YckC